MRSCRTGERAQTMAEFAMVAPILLMFIFAAIDFGGFYGTQMSVQNAARAGVRFAAVNPTLWSSAASAPANTIPGAVQAASGYGAVSNNGSNIRITYWLWDSTSSTLKQCGDASSGAFVSVNSYTQPQCVIPGSLIQLTVSYTYNPITPLPPLILHAFTTTATTQLLEEQ